MADNKKEKIFAAVLKLFKEGNKIEDIKVSDIAEKAGIGKGSIYLYFASKDVVIVEAAEYFFEIWLKPFEEFVIDNQKSFKEILTDFIEVHLNLLDEYSSFRNPKYGFEYMSLFNSETLPGTLDIVQKARLKYLRVLENILNAGVEQKVISFVNRYSVNVAAQAIIIILQYLGFKDMIEIEQDYTVDECRNAAYEMILRICK